MCVTLILSMLPAVPSRPSREHRPKLTQMHDVAGGHHERLTRLCLVVRPGFQAQPALVVDVPRDSDYFGPAREFGAPACTDGQTAGPVIIGQLGIGSARRTPGVDPLPEFTQQQAD